MHVVFPGALDCSLGILRRTGTPVPVRLHALTTFKSGPLPLRSPWAPEGPEGHASLVPTSSLMVQTQLRGEEAIPNLVRRVSGGESNEARKPVAHWKRRPSSKRVAFVKWSASVVPATAVSISMRETDCAWAHAATFPLFGALIGGSGVPV